MVSSMVVKSFMRSLIIKFISSFLVLLSGLIFAYTLNGIAKEFLFCFAYLIIIVYTNRSQTVPYNPYLRFDYLYLLSKQMKLEYLVNILVTSMLPMV